MSMTASERPDITERYTRASDTHDLRLRASGCDADVLMAAGYAARHDSKGAVALRAWRLRGGDLGAFPELVRVCSGWICACVGTPVRERPRLAPIKRVEADEVAARVLRWWRHNECAACCGRGSPLIPGSQRLDLSRDCTSCHGTGRSLVERVVSARYREHARYLASELECMDARIGVDIARILSAATRRVA
jgi:hypothetical protein